MDESLEPLLPVSPLFKLHKSLLELHSKSGMSAFVEISERFVSLKSAPKSGKQILESSRGLLNWLRVVKWILFLPVMHVAIESTSLRHNNDTDLEKRSSLNCEDKHYKVSEGMLSSVRQARITWGVDIWLVSNLGFVFRIMTFDI